MTPTFIPRPWRTALCGAVLVCLALPARAGTSAAPDTYALLINGGGKPASNYQSHLHHLQEMVALLESRGVPDGHISIFSADGESPANDLAVRDTTPPLFWLLEDTPTGKLLKPHTELTNTRWDGVTLHAARQSELREWFEHARNTIHSGGQLLLFVTDHGVGNEKDPNDGSIVLWNEKLSVRELKTLLEMLLPGVRVVMLMSQCYSGTFANAMYDGRGPSGASGDVCGFFSTTRDRRAYGCYPEGRDRDRIGHAFQFIDALGRHDSVSDAQRDVLLADDTPDVPLRTSDVYLQNLLSDTAKSRGKSFDEIVEGLLSEAARQPDADWEAQIRLLDAIGNAYGMFSPRRLAELESFEKGLPALIEQAKTYAERWKFAVNSVKEENLSSFLKANPAWRERLDPKALKIASEDERETILAPLLTELEKHARSQPDLWLRLTNLRELAQQSSEARWRLEVRRAAVLRLRSVLIGIAGRTLLRHEPGTIAGAAGKQETFDKLLACEAFQPGKLSPAAVETSSLQIKPYPPLESDIALLEQVLPSWLGVRFGTVAEQVRKSRGLLAGATILQAVYPDSPAAEAGLEAGDIAIGPPGRDFDAAGNLREWTMTSPRGTPVPLRVLRPGDDTASDEIFEAKLVLRPLPLKLPKLPGPPQVGQLAPDISGSLQPVGSGALPQRNGKPYLLFYWATWCVPCKRAVPEVMAFSEAKGIPVLAISDEDSQKVAEFLKERAEPFFDHVAVDQLRKSFIAHGVSGTPTIVLVDGNGIIRHRQVGYSPKEGLTIDGWKWPEKSNGH